MVVGGDRAVVAHRPGTHRADGRQERPAAARRAADLRGTLSGLVVNGVSVRATDGRMAVQRCHVRGSHRRDHGRRRRVGQRSDRVARGGPRPAPARERRGAHRRRRSVGRAQPVIALRAGAIDVPEDPVATRSSPGSPCSNTWCSTGARCPSAGSVSTGARSDGRTPTSPWRSACRWPPSIAGSIRCRVATCSGSCLTRAFTAERRHPPRRGVPEPRPRHRLGTRDPEAAARTAGRRGRRAHGVRGPRRIADGRRPHRRAARRPGRRDRRRRRSRPPTDRTADARRIRPRRTGDGAGRMSAVSDPTSIVGDSRSRRGHRRRRATDDASRRRRTGSDGGPSWTDAAWLRGRRAMDRVDRLRLPDLRGVPRSPRAPTPSRR